MLNLRQTQTELSASPASTSPSFHWFIEQRCSGLITCMELSSAITTPSSEIAPERPGRGSSRGFPLFRNTSMVICLVSFLFTIDLLVSRCMGKKKKKKQAKNGVTSAETQSPNRNLVTDPIVASASPRVGILNHSVWNFLINFSRVITPDKGLLPDPSLSLKENVLAWNNPLF